MIPVKHGQIPFSPTVFVVVPDTQGFTELAGERLSLLEGAYEETLNAVNGGANAGQGTKS
ncbi:uncharacterized protein N7500_004412 [Penicillium coprophilum]|uniref:uncharacterized protein n=1 Tax=Penicillium coprophilum TaxID=36646 RepID=UPI00238349E8|nr:uncharacterized protein N7500_004412 [Penicillium coprophilum]KAJ5162582.1 hypothetical protein N7500_004412 [Penicillium coprophilum]